MTVVFSCYDFNFCFSECCTTNGISGVCLELCSFDVDFAAIVNDKYDECLTFLPLYVTCATGRYSQTLSVLISQALAIYLNLYGALRQP